MINSLNIKEVELIKKSLLNQKIEKDELLTFYKLLDKLNRIEKIKNKKND